jgi:hypothetical protein
VAGGLAGTVDKAGGGSVAPRLVRGEQVLMGCRGQGGDNKSRWSLVEGGKGSETETVEAPRRPRDQSRIIGALARRRGQRHCRGGRQGCTLLNRITNHALT